MTQNSGGQSRPDVLNDVSTTTLDDLEQQFAQNDRDEWKRFTDSFGWSQADSDAVWNWFGQRPSEGTGSSSNEGFPEGPGTGGDQ